MNKGYRNVMDNIGAIPEWILSTQRLLEDAQPSPLPKKQRRHLGLVLVAVAICAALFTTALAFSHTLQEALSQALGGFASYTQESDDTMVTDQRVELKIISALSDGNAAQIYLEIRDIEGTRLSAQTDLSYNLRDTGADFRGSQYSSEIISYDLENHTGLFRISYVGTGSPARDATLDLSVSSITPDLRSFHNLTLPSNLDLSKDVVSIRLESGETVLQPEQTPAHVMGGVNISLSSAGIAEDGKLHMQYRYAGGINAEASLLLTCFGSRNDPMNENGTLGRYNTNSYDAQSITFQQNGIWYSDVWYNIGHDDLDDVLLEGDQSYIMGQIVRGNIIEGEWNLSIPLDDLPVTRYAVNQTVDGLEIEYLNLTTLGLSAECDPAGTYSALSQQITLFLDDSAVVKLHHYDGGMVSGYEYSFSHWTYDEPIEPDTVIGIAIGQWYIPLQGGAADAGYWLEAPRRSEM